MNELHERFLDQLSEQYGGWRKESSLFGSHTYGDIAELLCVSPSQFSKLISGTATDGMYQRSLRNLKQLEELKQLKIENQQLTVRSLDSAASTSGAGSIKPGSSWKLFLIAVPLLCLLTYTLGTYAAGAPEEGTRSEDNAYALSRFFDQSFRSPHVSPYLSTGDALAFCPCSAFEGKWELEKEYIIPIPAKKPGLYYVARGSDLRLKCLHSQNEERSGYIIAGFEQMNHELWIDTKNEPLSPRYFNADTKRFTKQFYNLNFESSTSFKKVATISSFMYNQFELRGSEIYRLAEPVGRYAKDVNQALADAHEVDVKDILSNVIGKMVKTNCNPTQNNNCNPNTLVEGESVMSFNCDFTIAIENLGIGGSYPYTKGFRLVEQNYSGNLLCSCED